MTGELAGSASANVGDPCVQTQSISFTFIWSGKVKTLRGHELGILRTNCCVKCFQVGNETIQLFDHSNGVTNELNSTSDSNNPSVTSAVGLIERIWEATWALRIISVVLFLDLASGLRSGHNLLEWSATSEPLWQSLGFLAVALAIFGLFAAILIPTLTNVLRQLLELLASILPKWLSPSDEARYRRPSGCVWPSVLHEQALREGSDFMLARYYDHVLQNKQILRSMEQIGDLTFGTVLLAVLDGLSPKIGWATTSLIHLGMEWMGVWGAFIAVLLFFGALTIVRQAWFLECDKVWVYFPPLADKLDAAERLHPY